MGRKLFAISPLKLMGLSALTIFATLQNVKAQSTDSTKPVIISHKKIKPTPPWFVERFSLSAGLFVPINNTVVSVNGQAGAIGTTIDFEKDLGFAKTTETFMADFQWRASRRSRFDLSYFTLNRSSTRTLQKDITFKDSTYHASASVNAYFNTDIYRFSYGYALFTNPKFEAGLLFGLHIIRIGVGIGLSTGNLGADASSYKVTAPLPDFGIWGGYAISPKWAVNLEADYLNITVDNINGRILGGNFTVSYKPIEKLKLALGYTGLNFRVEANEDKFAGYFKWGYNGPLLTAAFTFGKKPW